jgi:AbrB family looped-hinge helix DNA binding protein
MRTKLSDDGRITIPREIRERLGLRAGDTVDLIEEADGLHLHIRAAQPTSRFQAWRGYLRHLQGRNPDTLVDELRQA